MLAHFRDSILVGAIGCSPHCLPLFAVKHLAPVVRFLTAREMLAARQQTKFRESGQKEQPCILD